MASTVIKTLSGWSLTSNGRPCNGLIIGPPHSGKSHTLERIGIQAVSAGHHVWLATPDHQASHLLMEQADRVAATPTTIHKMFAEASRELKTRSASYSSSGHTSWSPSSGFPGMMLLVDDAHLALSDPTCQQLARGLARSGPKCGIGTIMATPTLDVAAFGGGIDAAMLRDNLSTNLLLLPHADQPATTG